MTPRNAITFIRRHGVVLEAARGLEPSLAAKVAGGPITGSWWGHAKGHEIYALTQMVHDSSAVLVCTLAKGRITYVHRRLWPAFVRLAKRFPAGALDKVQEIHTATGRHQRRDISFPEWVPEATVAAARSLSEREASSQIDAWLQRYGRG
jgi:hypothetical protein